MATSDVSTQPRIIDHPTLEQLRDSAAPEIRAHVARCVICTATVAGLRAELPRELVAETAFKWPADPMAEGGMAAIYLGSDRRLNREVILKLPHGGDPGTARMFEQRVAAEAKILAKLQHPSIVTIYELGRMSTGVPFCVMEKVSGHSLRDALDRIEDGPDAERERLQLLPSLLLIAEAVAYAHERRVVHRDITPSNILLGKRGEATLIDWGIARDLDVPSTGQAVLASTSGKWATLNAGTPPYVPLEQTQGLPADPSYDVYSFGMTLYEVVAGHTAIPWVVRATPEAREQELARFLQQLRDPPEFPPASPRDLELSGIIARAIAPRAERFTADELVTALKQYLHGELVFSHRYSLTGRMGRWIRGHKLVAVVATMLLVGTVAGALVWAQFSRAAQERAELRLAALTAEEAARVEAVQKDIAAAEAAAAHQRAREAELDEKTAQAQRREAEAARLTAESEAAKAQGQAETAAVLAAKAAKEKLAAVADKQAALTAQGQADAARVQAQLDREAAERARTAAHSAQSQAETERNEAIEARARAEAARSSAEAERNEAIVGRERAEAERDRAQTDRDAAVEAASAKLSAAQKRIEQLEAQLRAATRPAPSP